MACRALGGMCWGEQQGQPVCVSLLCSLGKPCLSVWGPGFAAAVSSMATGWLLDWVGFRVVCVQYYLLSPYLTSSLCVLMQASQQQVTPCFLCNLSWLWYLTVFDLG
jgi:hypothetical protein